MTISVIIPTARDGNTLAPLLKSLEPQLVPCSAEVIVVNDRPGMQRNDPSFCRVLNGERKGPARARNLGAAHARGTFLLFLDDDSRIDTHYLSKISAEIAARPGQAISGMQIALDRGNLFSLTAEWLLYHFVQAEQGRFAASNALAVRRDDFERCGGFDPSFPLAAGEDREFSLRWIASGFKIAIVKEAAIGHRFPETFLSLARQQWRYGRGAFHLRRCAPSIETPRARYYLRMFMEAPRRYGVVHGLAVASLSGIAQAILACGYLRERLWPAGTGAPFQGTFAR